MRTPTAAERLLSHENSIFPPLTASFTPMVSSVLSEIHNPETELKNDSDECQVLDI